MKVIVAESAGFCWGVKRAIEKARALAEESSEPIFTDGPLIHNQQVMERLAADGVRECNNPEELATGVLIIRAHGIPPERRSALRRLPVKLLDATCPDVAKTQGLIKKYAAKGYHTIIFGDVGHAEVTGLLGYSSGRGFVVTTPEEVSTLPDMELACLVAQSTQFPHSYERIINAVLARFPKTIVCDTICESTKSRQSELLALARQVDAIVVAGGTNSANTLRLVALARELRPTFHIQVSDELDKSKFRNFKTVGLTAGASTPDFVIEEIRQTLESM